MAVTGGTGFVGTHLMALARTRGFEVRALTRSWRPPETGVTWIEGALDRPEPLTRLCDGADAVVHIAGLIKGSRAEFEAANVAGTANMIDAARRSGVRRFVHISSLAAREPELSDYGWSKARSERLVAASGLEWTAIRPPAVYGPGDRETLELFRMAKRGFVALPPGGRFSIIHVHDLARLILDIIDQPNTLAETYEPDDGTEGGWDHKDFAQALGAALGRRAVTWATPRGVMKAASRLEAIFRRSKAQLTPDRVRYFCHPDWSVTPERRPPAVLWVPKVPTPQGLEETGSWYRAAGWL